MLSIDRNSASSVAAILFFKKPRPPNPQQKDNASFEAALARASAELGSRLPDRANALGGAHSTAEGAQEKSTNALLRCRSRLRRGGRADPSRETKFLRRVRGQGNINFPCSAYHEQDWQPYPVDPYSCYMYVMTIHTYIHTEYDSLGVSL